MVPRRTIAALERDGADERWALRVAPAWALNGASVALLPAMANMAGSQSASYIAGMIALGTATITVTVAQGFTEIAVAACSPAFFVSLATAALGPDQPSFVVIGSVIYAVIILRLHLVMAATTARLAEQTASNERLNASLVLERERLVRTQRALEDANRELAHDARHDPLTGLANRKMLMERLDEDLARLGPGDEISILYADLDHFKELNDRHGHAAGDELLQAVATRLTSIVRKSDTVVRMGATSSSSSSARVGRPRRRLLPRGGSRTPSSVPSS